MVESGREIRREYVTVNKARDRIVVVRMKAGDEVLDGCWSDDTYSQIQLQDLLHLVICLGAKIEPSTTMFIRAFKRVRAHTVGVTSILLIPHRPAENKQSCQASDNGGRECDGARRNG